MSKLPVWARKPDHKKEVVATTRGWMVKETGEMLKLVKNLDERLKELHQEAVESFSSIESEVHEATIKQDEKPSQEGSGDDVDQSTTEDGDEKTEESKPKRRGRPRKNKTDE